METIKGLIQEKSSKGGIAPSTGKAWVRWVFKINDKNYSTFDKKIGDKFNIGEFVEMEGGQKGGQKGEYWNMETMKKVDQPVEANNDWAHKAEQPQPTTESSISVAEGLLLQILDVNRQILAESKDANSFMMKNVLGYNPKETKI